MSCFVICGPWQLEASIFMGLVGNGAGDRIGEVSRG